LLDGTQNLERLPIDLDNDNDEILVGDVSNSGQTPRQSGDGGLSPPGDGNSGGSHGNDGNGNPEQSPGVRGHLILFMKNHILGVIKICGFLKWKKIHLLV